MVYSVIVERDDDRYSAIVPALPGLRTEGETRDTALAAARNAIRDRLARVEIVDLEIDLPTPGGYTPQQMALARAAAVRRGEPGAPITGKPWLDSAGYLAHLPDEMADAYEEELRRAREEANNQQVEP